MEDRFYLLSQPDQAGRALAITNLGRDREEVVWYNARTGQEEVLHSSDLVDVGWVVMHPKTRAPLMALSNEGRQERVFFDDSIKQVVNALPDAENGAVHFVSAAHDMSRVIWEVEHDTKGWHTYLTDTATGKTELLQAPGIARHAGKLSNMEPVMIPAGDGLQIPALLTRPKGAQGPAPMVILIHGGPVARSYWGWNGFTLWLANRGYAVLNVNYRGGAGYGRAFREAAIGGKASPIRRPWL